MALIKKRLCFGFFFFIFLNQIATPRMLQSALQKWRHIRNHEKPKKTWSSWRGGSCRKKKIKGV